VKVTDRTGLHYEQKCPDCGREEAAGSYCSFCRRRMGIDDWFHKEATPAQRAALERVRERRAKA